MQSLKRLFPNFQNKEEYFRTLLEESPPVKTAVQAFGLIILLSFACGFVMGIYHSFAQALAAGFKVSVLFSLSILICFPALFIIQIILGSKLGLVQTVVIILSGLLLTTIILLAFVPIIIFFILIKSDYYFLQLLHIAVFMFAGVFGMKNVLDALQYSCEKKNVYPKTGVTVFKAWAVIFAFVSVQLAWNLRPFLGDRGLPFKFFRQYEGNFYEAVIYSVKKIIEPETAASPAPKACPDKPHQHGADTGAVDLNRLK
jgi:hypothetical protein